MTDFVALRFPRDSRYYAVARLVVGGMAAPLQMSYDALDDLQLAISSLLDHDDLALAPGEGHDVELRLEVSEHELVASLGTFTTGGLERALQRSSAEGGELGLKRLLDTIVDGVTVDANGSGERVSLTKRVKALA
jgi:anti-sigma regulatory factor (Ser/Thr protein kinase)